MGKYMHTRRPIDPCRDPLGLITPLQGAAKGAQGGWRRRRGLAARPHSRRAGSRLLVLGGLGQGVGRQGGEHGAAAADGQEAARRESFGLGPSIHGYSHAQTGRHPDCTLITPPTHPQLLSSNREALIHDVLERDWIPRLLDWLKLSDYPAIQVRETD